MLRRVLGYAQPEEYVEWAVDLLCADTDGANLRILAGLNARIDRADVEEYFLLTCKDLGLQPTSVNDADPLPTARLVHEAFSRGDVTAADAIRMIADLYRRSEYRETLLSSWWRMREQVDRGEGHSGSPEAPAALDDAVRGEWSLLERCLAAQLPSGWNLQSWCNDCNHLGELTLVQPTLADRFLRLVGLRSATSGIVCARCGSRRHRSLRERDVLLEYLDHVESADSTSAARVSSSTPNALRRPVM